VILTGLHTNICVRHTAADAFFRGYKIIVAKDGVEAFTQEDHEQGLKYLKGIYNAKITIDRKAQYKMQDDDRAVSGTNRANLSLQKPSTRVNFCRCLTSTRKTVFYQHPKKSSLTSQPKAAMNRTRL